MERYTYLDGSIPRHLLKRRPVATDTSTRQCSSSLRLKLDRSIDHRLLKRARALRYDGAAVKVRC